MRYTLPKFATPPTTNMQSRTAQKFFSVTSMLSWPDCVYIMSITFPIPNGTAMVTALETSNSAIAPVDKLNCNSFQYHRAQ